MAANCEELEIRVTGYDCLDIMQALSLWSDMEGIEQKTMI